MTFFRKGDTRTIWVFAVLAIFILIISFTGLWKRFDSLIFAANLLGFEKDVTPLGASIIGVNLNKGDLRYFTGETWKVIDLDKSSDFVLGDYNFNPKEIKDSFYNFYVKTPRKPSTLSFESNHWRYWDVGFIQSGWGKATISSATKKGFAGPSNTERANLGYTNLLDYEGIYYISAVGTYFPNFLNFELNPLVLQKTISWRDSILEDNSCESFMPLKISLKTPQLSPPQNQNDPKYTVRKIDEYLFVDLENPVSEGAIQKWDNVNCFNFIEFEDIDRRDWKNNATVEISWLETYGINNKKSISWIPEKGWISSDIFRFVIHNRGANLLRLPLIRTSNRNISKYANSFIIGFQELIRDEGVFDYSKADFFDSDDSKKGEVLVNEKSVNIDFLKESIWDGSEEEIIKFEYAVLDEYNKHLLPPFYFKKSTDGNLLLYKYETGKIEVFTNVYLKNDLVYSTLQSNIKVPFQSIKTNVFIGKLDEEQKIRIFDVPTGDVNYNSVLADLDETNKDLTDEGINYIKNRKLNSFMIKEVKA